MSSSKNIKSSAGIFYVIIFFNIAVSLFYTPWMIRQIGVANYGLYVLVISFLAYFTTDYGLWQAVNKLLTEYRTKEDYATESRVMKSAVSLYLLLDLGIAIVLCIVYLNIEQIYTNLSTEQIATFKIIFLIAAIIAVLSFPFVVLSSVFMSREYFFQLRIFELIKKLGVVIATVALLFLDFGVISLVLAYGLVPLVIRCCEYIYLLRKGIKVLPGRMKKRLVYAIISLSFWLLLIVLGELFMTNITPSILAKFNNATEIAIFAIGLSIYSYLSTFAGALNGLFLPKVYKLRKECNDSSILNLGEIASAVQLLILGLLVTGIIVIGQDFIYLWLGHQFNASYWVAVFLVLPTLIYFCQPIEETELFATNTLKYRSYMMISAAIASIIFSILFAPIYGAIGTALAIAISKFTFLDIGMNIVYKRKLNRPRKPFIILFMKFSCAYVLASLTYQFLKPVLFEALSWPILLLEIVLYTTIYAIFTMFIAVPKRVKLMLFTPILNRFKRNPL